MLRPCPARPPSSASRARFALALAAAPLAAIATQRRGATRECAGLSTGRCYDRRVRWPIISVIVALAGSLAGCPKAGGEYVQGDRRGGDVDRGETNGRRFDFVSNKPEQDDWQIRITGSSMWVSYAREDDSDKLGSINLTDKETRKLWKLIDALDVPNRKVGKKDEDEGYVSIRLKEPREDGQGDAKTHHIYISRASEDRDLLALARYLQDLTEKYKRERPSF